jgi:hypothetical protein
MRHGDIPPGRISTRFVGGLVSRITSAAQGMADPFISPRRPSFFLRPKSAQERPVQAILQAMLRAI